MKKVLSFILVLSMVLGSFGMAFAAPATSDIAGHLNEKAILRLNKLGIVKGDDRGFAPDSNITRAEFAVLVVRALGLEGSANVAKGETQFTDVTMTNGYDWATGAINVATRLGHIQGYGNGKFGPGDNIKYEDAITLLVRILGYEPAAQEKGGYPVGYLVVAEQDIDMTDHVKGSTGEAATRGAVFQLLDNSLTKPLMIQTGFGTEKKYVVSGQKGTDTVKQTILTDKLGIEVREGIVTANHRVDSKLKANQIKIDDKKYDVAEDIDVDAILGLEVSAWEDKDEVLFRYEVETEEDEVLYGTVKTNELDKKVVKVEVTNKENKNEKFAWSEVSKANETKDAVVYVNNEKIDIEDEEDVKDLLVNSYGRFVLNEYKEVAFAYLFNFEDVGVATKVEKDEIEFINLKDADKDAIELDKAEEVFVFNTDFTKAELKDIEAGTAVFNWVDEDDNFFIVIKNETVEGTLEAVRVSSKENSDRITVDGKNISLVSKNAMFSDDKGDGYKLWDNEVEDLVDEKVTVILDLTGKVLALTTDVNVTSSTVYGVATYITTGRNPVLTVYTNEGKEVDYKFAERDDATIGKLNEKVNTSSQSYGKDFATVSFKVNKDGEIAKGTLKAEDIKVEKEAIKVVKEDNKKYVTIGDKTGDRYYINEKTVFVKAFKNDKLKPSLIKYDNIINKSIEKATDAIVIGEVGKDAKLIVFTDADFQAVDDTKHGLVTEAVTVERNGDYTTKIAVAGEGEAKYIVPERNTVKKGQIVEFTVNDKGEISVDRKITVTDAKAGEFKEVAEKDGNYIKFKGDSKNYLADKNTVIWDLKTDGALDKSTSRVSKGDIVFVEADGTEIKVLLVANKYYEKEFGGKPTTPGEDADGEVTYRTNTQMVIDGTIYRANADTIVKDAKGKVIGFDFSVISIGDEVSVKGDVYTVTLAEAVKAAGEAKTAYEKAGGLTTADVYKAVEDALNADPQVTADIVKATKALNEATKALEDAANEEELVEAADKAVKALEEAIAKFDKTEEKLTAAKDLVAPAETAVAKVNNALLKARLADAKAAIKAEENAIAKIETEKEALKAVNEATTEEEMVDALDALNKLEAIEGYDELTTNADKVEAAQKVLEAKKAEKLDRAKIEAALA